MYQHMRSMTTALGIWLAGALVPAIGCSPSAMPDSTEHPANPSAPSAATPSETTPSETTPPVAATDPTEAGHAHDGHAGHDAHAGHGQPAGAAHDAHGAHGAAAADQATPGEDATALLAAEQEALTLARPVLDKHCARCHTKTGKKAKKIALTHFSMDSYPFGGHHATEIGEEVREVLGLEGKKASMPLDQKGVVKGEELALVVAWTEAFDRSHAAGLHDHGDGAAHGAGHQHGAGSAPAGEHQHGAEKKPAAKKPAAKKPAAKPVEKKPDEHHQHGQGHEHKHH